MSLPIPAPIEREDARFPTALLGLRRAPKTLWFWGDRLPESLADQPTPVAIVGSRKASGRGCETAMVLAKALAASGHAIVSGGAFGIDAAAHEGALAAQAAPTFAFLGCGVDVVYPDRHGRLFDRIRESGCLISEFGPGVPPRKQQFPARNRLIAGLGGAVVVVEAALRSGALGTAKLARDMGRIVLAVPGSPGTDALLRAGHALAVQSEAEVQDALAGRLVPAPNLIETVAARAMGLSPQLGALVAAVAQGYASPPELALVLAMPVSEVLALLMVAELEGVVLRGPRNDYEVGRGH
ncbi:MAG: DNA-processing protein DprA [Deltaproteobacteria bacterium]|nr:DNA-processing protein DprA [Deltaproteobacteria bacterium]